MSSQRGERSGQNSWRTGNENVLDRQGQGDPDRDKNHEAVCNMLSMLTCGIDSPTQGQEVTMAADHRMLLLNMANSPESCMALRRAGCIPLLIEILHPPSASSIEGIIQPPEIIRLRAARALKNIVQFNPDEKMKRNELRVLKLLEGIRSFNETVKNALKEASKIENEESNSKDSNESTETTVTTDSKSKIKSTNSESQQMVHPSQDITALMKLSFNEEHRNPMCLLGAIHALADLILSDHLIHGNSSGLKDECLLLRRYSGMTLTNLTFGDGTNKALLCGMREFMSALVSQLDCDSEDVCQVTASVLRNLSWRADSTSKAALRESNAVAKLTLAAIKSTKESTLKATLSALWNLSAHSAINKSSICTASPSSLPFLVSILRPNNPLLKTLRTPMTIIENAGGILSNISSQISSKPDLRKILRDNHCYEILLEHLKSGSLAVVSNACGTLWNLTSGSGCEEDQRKLLDLNAIPMLKSLIYSKHGRISQGASAALRNLLSSRFAKDHTLHLDTRLTAQIYSTNVNYNHSGSSSDRGIYLGNKKTEEKVLQSPVSDNDYDFEFNPIGPIPHHMNQENRPPPPFAHQQSSSIFQQNSHPLQLHFHHTPQLPFGNHRPTSISYSVEPEPLDLSIASAKSSPIHIISAAEFGINHSKPSLRKRNSSRGTYQLQHQPHQHMLPLNTQPPFLNPPNMLHHSPSGGRSTHGQGHQPQNPISMRKFNQSCPEILSRFQSVTPVNVQGGQSLGEKPLDFSASSSTANTSSASSLRGGTQSGTQNDCSGPGDTTFNYSLKFSEVDVEEDLLYAAEESPNVSAANTSTSETPSAAAVCSKSEDTLKTYCYEGTPNNFSISNSCQDLMQELEFEQNKAGTGETTQSGGNNRVTNGGNNKLQPIDETPKQYYVEGTPAIFSRTSSLSSINSSGLNGGENKADYAVAGEVFGSPESCLEGQGEHKQCDSVFNKQHFEQVKKKPQQLSLTPNPSQHPARVTFSAEETPLMFSRSSSVASLDSLDVGGNGGNCLASSHNDDDLSDFSRRASEVVSPSDLPDSPRAMAPPLRIPDKKSDCIAKEEELNNQKLEDEDTLKVFSMEEKSGLNSCRSLSPLTIDGEVLPMAKGKAGSNEPQAFCNKVSYNNVSSTPKESPDYSAAVMSKLPLGNAPVPPPKPSHHKIHGQNSELPSPNMTKPDYDELKVFAMEGTPFYGVSNATSLSDLMADIDNDQAQQPQLILCAEDSKSGKLTAANSNPPTVTSLKEQDRQQHTQELSKDINLINDPKANGSAVVTTAEDPIYSDVQLLQKCIRVGRAAGIPKSKSEFRINSSSGSTNNGGEGRNSNSPLMTTSLHEGQPRTLPSSNSTEVDDPDLAALIMKGRCRKEKVNSGSRGKDKSSRKGVLPEIPKRPTSPAKLEALKEPTVPPSPKPRKSLVQTDNKVGPELPKTGPEEEIKIVEESTTVPTATPKLPPQTLATNMEASQISTTSLGSEWNDETPTFSSPIPSMSISTAFKLVAGNDAVSPPASVKHSQVMPSAFTTSTMSMNQELLDNIDPPSCFSNLVSSTDCAANAAALAMKQSTISERMNKKWRNLNDANNASTCSNLTGQRPPPDFDLENSMISVASIKSEIFELSSATNPDMYQSAMEDLVGQVNDTSLGGNTYTIFPPANVANATNVIECKSTELLSEGNTVVSEDLEDFTDAEDIEEFETAPADDGEEKQRKDAQESEENDDKKGKKIVDCVQETKEVKEEIKNEVVFPKADKGEIVETDLDNVVTPPNPKPLMEVHPMDAANRFDTFVIKKTSPLSSRSSPRQKRREDPERYKTHTITHADSFTSVNDSNGNPAIESLQQRFSSFRVGGPRVVNPTLASRESIDSSVDSTPGSSPKGIRGRRKMLYSSLPPGSIVKKKGGPPPVPPKPSRTVSPARSANGSVYVRPTRTSELRTAANSSRDNSPGRGISSSRTSSNSSLNLIHRPVDVSAPSSLVSVPGRPKIAPKPPVRTTTASSAKNFSGSASNVQNMKTSNSTSFGFGVQNKNDKSAATSNGKSSNMKGYSTLPKSSKLGSGLEDYSPEANSHPKATSKIGKIQNLWRKMEFHKSKDNTSVGSMSLVTTPTAEYPPYGFEAQPPVPLPTRKPTLKFSNFFGRKKEKVATVSANVMATGNSAGSGGVWVKRDGENKALVAPFNYTPPCNAGEVGAGSKAAPVVNPPTVDSSTSESTVVTAAAPAGSAKITTV